MLESLIICILLVVILTFVWPPDSPWSPWWRTSRKVARKACRLAIVSAKDIVYELGSGDGEFVLTASSEFSAKKAVGIEIDYSRYFVSQIKKLIVKKRNVQFVRSDFKKISLREADVVYFYLVPRVIDRIMPKLSKELKKGTRIVSYKYRLPMKEERKIDNLFLYVVK